MSMKRVKSKKSAANMEGIMDELNEVMLDLVGEGKAYLHLLIPKVAVLLHIQKKITKILEVLGSYTKSESIAHDVAEWIKESAVDLSKYPKLEDELGNFYNLINHHVVNMDDITAAVYTSIYNLPRDKLKNANVLVKLTTKCTKDTSANCNQCKVNAALSATPAATSTATTAATSTATPAASTTTSATKPPATHYIENEIGLETLYLNRQQEMTDEYLVAVSKEFGLFKKETFITSILAAFVKVFAVKAVTRQIRELVVADDLAAFGTTKYTFLGKLPFGGYYMFAPILPQIDFKILFDNARGDNVASKMLLSLIDKFATYVTCVVKLVTGHSFDTKNFSHVITQALLSLRESTGGRNNKIFTIIENSSHVFENNFTKYYNEYQATENPFIMFSSYIDELQKEVIDPNSSRKDGAELIRQFRDLKNTLQTRIRNAPIKGNKIKQFNKLSAIFDTLVKDNTDFDKEDAAEDTANADSQNTPEEPRAPEIPSETPAPPLTKEEIFAKHVEPAFTDTPNNTTNLLNTMQEYLAEMTADLPNREVRGEGDDEDSEDNSEDEDGDSGESLDSGDEE